MAALPISFASLLLALAGLLWWEGTSWGQLIAWFLTMWAALFVAWGLLALQPRRLLVSLVAVAMGAASASSSLLWLTGGWWPWGIGCTVGGSLAVVFGLWRAHRLLRRRA